MEEILSFLNGWWLLVMIDCDGVSVWFE